MRGEIFRLLPRRNAKGHEQQGRRFGVVVLASRYVHLTQWLTVPTSTSARPYIFRPQIQVPGVGPTRALCDGVLAVDPEARLGDRVGYLSRADMTAVDRALTELLELI